MSLVQSQSWLAESPASTEEMALVVADAGWHTTANLFRAIDRPNVSSLLLQCCDVANARTKGIPVWRWWGSRPEPIGPKQWSQQLVLPPGWMKRYPKIGMKPIQRAIDRWRRSLPFDGPLALVMTYPHYRYLRDLVRPDVQVYLNLDDYALYWPGQADEVRALERQLVSEVDLTACVAQARAEYLRSVVPEAAARIRHVPHGTPEAFLSDEVTGKAGPAPSDLDDLPRPLLGYVGGLEDRVDWPLLIRVAEEFPEASIVLIGKEPRDGSGDWFESARRCLAMPNVHAVGFRPQERLGEYLRSFDACLIPYRVDHPFNQVCCPTKIMDFMGSGRPIVATNLPECRLYAGVIDVATDTDDFLGAIASLSFLQFDDGREWRRLELARTNSCRRVVGRLLDALRPNLAEPIGIRPRSAGLAT